MLINQFPNKDQFFQMAEESKVIPVCVEMLADTETPVSLLRKRYKNKNPIFLFESVEGGERWGRYSFLGVSARIHILVYQKFIEIKENGFSKQILHNGDPLPILRNLMKRYRPAQIPELPRFWGGLVGYLTYEMVSFFESIPNLLTENKQQYGHHTREGIRYNASTDNSIERIKKMNANCIDANTRNSNTHRFCHSCGECWSMFTHEDKHRRGKNGRKHGKNPTNYLTNI